LREAWANFTLETSQPAAKGPMGTDVYVYRERRKKDRRGSEAKAQQFSERSRSLQLAFGFALESL
jgi:hypothetical protein